LQARGAQLRRQGAARHRYRDSCVAIEYQGWTSTVASRERIAHSRAHGAAWVVKSDPATQSRCRRAWGGSGKRRPLQGGIDHADLLRLSPGSRRGCQHRVHRLLMMC
jgi:hypothetical protein